MKYITTCFYDDDDPSGFRFLRIDMPAAVRVGEHIRFQRLSYDMSVGIVTKVQWSVVGNERNETHLDVWVKAIQDDRV